jgi:hypothetical protein
VTTKVELVGTVRFTVEIREADLIGEAGSLVGAAQWMVGDVLGRHFSGFGPITAEVESWDHGEVLAYGAYRDPVKCPVCGGVHAEGGGDRVHQGARCMPRLPRPGAGGVVIQGNSFNNLGRGQLKSSAGPNPSIFNTINNINS